MKRKPPPRDENGLTPDDRRIWTRVSGSVSQPKVRKPARIPLEGPALQADLIADVTLGQMRPHPARPVAAKPARSKAPPQASAAPSVKTASQRPKHAPDAIEPNRKRRIAKERDPIEARIDLHGFGRFEAEDQLRRFLTSCQSRGLRAVLVITGQGRLGGGVIRASFVDWVHSPALRGVVSGFTNAHQKHGGDGAFYVTLKRLP